MKEHRRIAIIFWEGYLGVSPSIINALKMFEQAGFEVDVILKTPPAGYAEIPTFSSRVRIYQLGQVKDSKEANLKKLIFALPLKVVSFIVNLRNFATFPLNLNKFTKFSEDILSKNEYDLIIGVDTVGLWVASNYSLKKNIPLIYWSLELTFMNRGYNPIQKIFKLYERRRNRLAVGTIIQDPGRAQCLRKENLLPADHRFFFIPNAPSGAAVTAKNDFLYKRLGIEKSRPIILHIGMIAPEFQTDKIVRASLDWPLDWALVFHERTKRSEDHPYIKQLRNAGSSHLFLSLEPVPYEQLDELVASGTIGLAFYDPAALGQNVQEVGMASGKLNQYLKCGIPVICSDFPSLREVVERHQLGICISHFQDLKNAIAKILGNYQRYRSNALQYYSREIEFGSCFGKFLNFINSN